MLRAYLAPAILDLNFISFHLIYRCQCARTPRTRCVSTRLSLAFPWEIPSGPAGRLRKGPWLFIVPLMLRVSPTVFSSWSSGRRCGPPCQATVAWTLPVPHSAISGCQRAVPLWRVTSKAPRLIMVAYRVSKRGIKVARGSRHKPSTRGRRPRSRRSSARIFRPRARKGPLRPHCAPHLPRPPLPKK